ncbi:MAG: DNA replication/repair protein RecF [Candidatus Eremiobacteraeota bacterium]|nr:DNA replication/repair protein RecF [Candidatus Eremiobacteraeota bacterium]
MRVESLELANFRNYAALRFEPPEGACILVGRNAQGKSNVLEALALLALGKSFRAVRESDLIRLDAPAASVTARVRTRAGSATAGCVITRAGEGARKRFLRDGRSVSYGNFLGGIMAVTFVPADLALVTGPASLRRRLLNAALSQIDRGYYRDLAAYAKVLAQKNAFLKSPDAGDRALLATYNAQVVDIGARLVSARMAYVRRLAHDARIAHARWVNGAGELEVTYAPSPFQDAETTDAVSACLAGALEQLAPAEAARRVSLVGPHRDDLALSLGGRPLARYGSQGQQRTAVLAIKAAEYALAHAAAGEAPLLLLDDVLSELDEERRTAFLSSIAGFEQAFITATHVSDVALGMPHRVIRVSAGRLVDAPAHAISA